MVTSYEVDYSDGTQEINPIPYFPPYEVERVDEQATNPQIYLSLSDRRPGFIPQAVIEQHAERISEEVTPHMMRGLELFMQKEGLGAVFLKATPQQRQAWLWAVKASRYNAVYFVSRKEAEEGLAFIRDNTHTIDVMGEFIDLQRGAAPIANYALHEYVRCFAKTPENEVKTATKSIPRYAIQGYNQRTLVARRAHFLGTDPVASFDTSDEIHDWHDLAHVLAASSSSGAFGVKYHDGLDTLERYYRALTEGEGSQDGSGPVFSDGLLFSQLSRPLFEHYESMRRPDGMPQYSPDEIHAFIVQELYAYLGGERALLHPGIGAEVKAGRPIDPLELAVCIQNKRYERRAAEVERDILVRGSPDGLRGDSSKDPLFPLPRSKRLEYIAQLGADWLYFETRNLLRHRAHEDALGQFAGYLLGHKKAVLAGGASPTDHDQLREDIFLLEAVIAFYQMDDLRKGEEINLYRLVGDIVRVRQGRCRHGKTV